MIIGGTIKYGETRKIADFENKRADVELAFNVAEGQEAANMIDHVKLLTRQHCADLLGGWRPEPCPAPQIAPPKVHSKRAPKMPVPEHLVSEALKNPPPVAVEAPDPLKWPEPSAVPNEEAPLVIAEKVITDAELMDATTKQQQQVKNAPAIRKLLTDLGLKSPPRLIDLPQEKRQEYLTKLQDIKPLA